MKRVSFIVVVLALVAGCPNTITVGGTEVWEHAWDDAKAKVLPSAAFDLQCPAEKIELAPLVVPNGEFPTRIGATGCGKQMAYQKTPSGWVANTESK